MHDGRAFVLNKQTPNKQLWLSSPISGPQRYELADRSGDEWLQVRSRQNLTSLLETEFNQHFVEAEMDQIKL